MEKYFEVKKDSKLYNDYFTYISGRQVLLYAYNTVCAEFGIEATSFCPDRNMLCIVPTKEDRKKFADDMMKSQDGCFKKKSPQTKRWIELIKDIKFLSKPGLIYYMHISGHWHERLFHVGDRLIASVAGENCSVDLPEFAIEMKASEFYQAIEEEKIKAGELYAGSD